MHKAIIIDDEPPACEVLRSLLAAQDGVDVVGEAGTMDEARARLQQPDYDLVFLDVQLRGGTGFDLVPFVRPGARIVFVTAYDQHALRAFEVNAVDYLVKPVAPARLAGTLARLGDRFGAGATDTAAPFALGKVLALDDRVLLKLGVGSERFVRLEDIRFVASRENYTELAIGARGERLLVRKTMKVWEDSLPPSYFVRVHRQMIVNLAHVQQIVRVSDATSELRLAGVSEPVAVSYRYLADLRGALSAAGRTL